jgi:hypothetical protein
MKSRDPVAVYNQLQGIEDGFRDTLAQVGMTDHDGALFALCTRVAMEGVGSADPALQRIDAEADHIVLHSAPSMWPGLAAVREVLVACDRFVTDATRGVRRVAAQVLRATLAKCRSVSDSQRERVQAALEAPNPSAAIDQALQRHLMRRTNEALIARELPRAMQAALADAGLGLTEHWGEALPQESVLALNGKATDWVRRRGILSSRELKAADIEQLCRDVVAEFKAQAAAHNRDLLHGLGQPGNVLMAEALRAAGVERPDDWRTAWPAAAVQALDRSLAVQVESFDGHAQPLTRSQLQTACGAAALALAGEVAQANREALQAALAAGQHRAESVLGADRTDRVKLAQPYNERYAELLLAHHTSFARRPLLPAELAACCEQALQATAEMLAAFPEVPAIELQQRLTRAIATAARRGGGVVVLREAVASEGHMPMTA